MGLHDEEQRARDWVENKLDFDRDGNYNTFEVCVRPLSLGSLLKRGPSHQTTIRVLGGLLSAHYLTNATIYLERAVELADRMIPVFDSPSGLPWSMVNLGQRKGVPDGDNNGLSSTAEAGTLQLEFKYLSYLTDDDTYWKVVEKVFRTLMQSLEISSYPSLLSLGYERYEEGTDPVWSGPYFYLVSMRLACLPKFSRSHMIS